MTVGPGSIRELLAHVENAKLDFKRVQYDWTAEGNHELAKDLMAIGNVLGPRSEPGYILIGVDQAADGTGVAIGVAPESHLDDAVMHQKVSGLLNRTPGFTYVPLELDGATIGVFEVLAGGRPFFPLRDVGRLRPLRRFEPRYRNGSATEVASPDQVIAWAREDDPIAQEARALELQALKADMEIIPRSKQLSVVVGSAAITIKIGIENHGQRPYAVSDARYLVRPTPDFLSKYPPIVPEFRLSKNQALTGRMRRDWSGGMVKPGERVSASFELPRAGVREHLQRIAGRGLPSAISLKWFMVTWEVDCALGTNRKVHTSTIRLDDAKT